MNIIHPVINLENRRCVYKMCFPDDSFYIGSTQNLKQRISGYRRAFNGSIGNVNKLIAAKLERFDTVEFKIIEIVPEWGHTKTYEHKWILENIGNPDSLNRSKSAFSNAGMVKSK